MVFWIGQKLRRILLADDWHALRSAAAQKNKGERHGSLGGIIYPGQKPAARSLGQFSKTFAKWQFKLCLTIEAVSLGAVPIANLQW